MQQGVAGGGPAFAIDSQGVHKSTPDVIWPNVALFGASV
jgi:hypothetical protein